MIQLIIRDVDQISHMGQIYEHNIVVELPSGQVIGLYDPDMLISPDDISHVRQVQIGLLTNEASIEQVAQEDLSREIKPATTDPQQAENHTYRGTVAEVGEVTDSVTEVTLDVGDGTVKFRRKTAAAEQFTAQMPLVVEAERSDVWAVG